MIFEFHSWLYELFEGNLYRPGALDPAQVFTHEWVESITIRGLTFLCIKNDNFFPQILVFALSGETSKGSFYGKHLRVGTWEQIPFI